MQSLHKGLIAGLVALCGAGQVQAQYGNLHAFTGGASDGLTPFGSLTLAGATLYGMTPNGGVSNQGVIFKMNTVGAGYTNLHAFAGSPADGAAPEGSLTLDGTTLYGMTLAGGSNSVGVVFAVQTDGSGYTNLHTFTGSPVDGGVPFGSLTLGGTTLYGMALIGGVSGLGVLFAVQTDGSGYTNLHAFTGSPVDGGVPFGSLTLSGTTLYGMTQVGGTSNDGVVFQIHTDGSGYTNLHSFAGIPNDGLVPFGSLTLAGTTLYGMALVGGISNMGVVFAVQTDGSGYTNLHAFTGGPADGATPEGSLMLAGTTLYGMTTSGGISNLGMAFMLNTDGSGYTNLHAFTGGPGEGALPIYGALTLAGTTLYGMTVAGGVSNSGVVFALNLFSPAQLFFQEDGGGVASLLLNTNGVLHASRLLGLTGGQLRTAGDLDGDGVSDLLFQTAAGDTAGWLLNADGSIRTVINWGNVGAWKVRACADYVGEGHAQLFFQDPGGIVAFWHLDTNGVFQSAEVLVQAGPWQLGAASPHAVGGRADLYWQTATGLVAVWRHQPDGAIIGEFLGFTTGWALCGAVDVDGNGAGDLLWQTAKGLVGGWFMNGNGTVRDANYWLSTGTWKLKAAGH